MWTFTSLTTSSLSFHSNWFSSRIPLWSDPSNFPLTSFTMLPSPCSTVEIINFGRCPNVSFSAHTIFCTGQKLLFLPLEFLPLSHISCVSLVAESPFLIPSSIKMIFVECTANSCPGEIFSFLKFRSLQLFQSYKWFGCLWIKLSLLGLSNLVDSLVLVGMLLYYAPFTFRWWLEQCSVGCLRQFDLY